MNQVLSFLKEKLIHVAFLVIIIMSFVWLIMMTSKLGSKGTTVELEYRVYLENTNFKPIIDPHIEISDGIKHEDALFKVFKEAEEHLREQLNVWLTIVGFFGVIFGLLLPIINYLLQRQSLADERKRMESDLERRFEEAIKKVDAHAIEAKAKAELAMDTLSRAGLRGDGSEAGVSKMRESENPYDVAMEKKDNLAKEIG